MIRVDCPTCKGRGSIGPEGCTDCRGTGWEYGRPKHVPHPDTVRPIPPQEYTPNHIVGSGRLGGPMKDRRMYLTYNTLYLNNIYH